MQITKDEFTIWKAMPETQKAFETLDVEIRALKEELAMGGTIDFESSDRTAINTAIVVGRIRGLHSLMQMEHEDQ